MYVGASLWVNSEMGTSLFHMYVGASLWVNSEIPPCSTPGCEWSLTWMYVGASLWVNSEMGTSLVHTCQYFL